MAVPPQMMQQLLAQGMTPEQIQQMMMQQGMAPQGPPGQMPPQQPMPQGPPGQLPTAPPGMAQGPQGPPGQLPTAPPGMPPPAPEPQGPLGTLDNPFTMKGILDDPTQLQQLTASPMFNMGMGLLSHRYDESINPFEATLGGLQQSQAYQEAAEDRGTLEEQRNLLTDFYERQRKALEEQQNGGRQSAVEQMLSPSVQEGLMANTLDPQNLDLYKRMAWSEILGR